MSLPRSSITRLRDTALLLGLGLMARIGLRDRSDPRHISPAPAISTADAPKDDDAGPPLDPYLERILRGRPRRPIDVPPWVDRLDDRIR